MILGSRKKGLMNGRRFWNGFVELVGLDMRKFVCNDIKKSRKIVLRFGKRFVCY